ncbi:hypothetical protein ABT168_25130 [Streptomyces sp. NPDC001793]|uniref:hypothetical protein n=1 Tax=Streptomyces sp. NPDC001793 TaxID=3154657 RepID=UPI003327B131
MVLYGDGPAALVPPVTDARLTAFALADLRGLWQPALARPEYWLRDAWVDLGLLTLARATVTLRDDTLVSKRRALAVLPGHPAAVAGPHGRGAGGAPRGLTAPARRADPRLPRPGDRPDACRVRERLSPDASRAGRPDAAQWLTSRSEG